MSMVNIKVGHSVSELPNVSLPICIMCIMYDYCET